MKKRILAPLLLVLLSDLGWAQESGVEGKVVFYRSSSIRGGVFGCQIYQKGRQLISLKRSSYFQIDVAAGQNLFSTETASLVVNVEPNHTTYVECATMPEFTIVRKDLRIIDKEALPAQFAEYKELKSAGQ